MYIIFISTYLTFDLTLPEPIECSLKLNEMYSLQYASYGIRSIECDVNLERLILNSQSTDVFL